MICNGCKKEFDNINGLKFCPYCGEKIEEQIETEINYQGMKPITEEIKRDTLRMPVITDEDLKKYNRKKFFTDSRNIFMQKKVIVPIVTLFIIGVVAIFGYKLLIAKPVDQVTISEDLIGKIITLPKGTKIEIKKNYIKSFSIKSRNTDKSKGEDDIKVAITLNNGVVEVKTLLSLMYINQGKNKWEFNGKITMVGDAVIKPVIGMDENQFLENLKKLTININDEAIELSGKEVKSLNIDQRTPDLEKGKEAILVVVKIDSGVLSATGNIKCNLNFENEKWSINSIERNSTEDFILALSTSFSEQRIIEIVKKQGLEETVTQKDLFAGKGFSVSDNFTKSFVMSNKKFDGQTKILTETASRGNVAGQIKLNLSTNYTFSLSFSDIAFVKKEPSTVLSATVNEISNDSVIATIANVSIEGANVLFWFPDNHKITTEEAKTFKTESILSKKGLNNIKYVYGNITYMNGKNTKTVSVVALYSLIYDGSKGYNFKLDKVVGEDSPNFDSYSKAAITQ